MGQLDDLRLKQLRVRGKVTEHEDLLAGELIALGAQDVRAAGRMVRFTADRPVPYAADLWYRKAIRILRPLGEFTAANEDQLYAAARNIDWTEWMPSMATLEREPRPLDRVRRCFGALIARNQINGY